MLTKEAEVPTGIPSPSLREKRLEIITGITQQVALAIDNDNLQKERVKREMLERELQLAREIQTTFLPEGIPQIAGYDMDMRWRPALQVGGDFYDLFPLQDGRLGIVIADVADKGMPAALYMVLARTLIRAVAQEERSPARALMRVNDLLLVDSKRGLFVTVTYVVFSPMTGSIVYANAGHNPPLYYSSRDKKIVSLQKTGMVLGILPEIDIMDGEIILHPGDRLLLYTDGVTEAFSTQGQLYGIDRLEGLFSRIGQSGAKIMLDNIENSVLDFSQGLPLSDDLTLIGLIRELIEN
jgi:serine phosphatase RsbU (regulator of sigma subunit)